MTSLKNPMIKFCGITREEDAIYASDIGVHFIGLIFARSPRQVSMEKGQEIVQRLNGSADSIGVFVNEEMDTLIRIADFVGVSGVQLHGQETPDYLQELKARRPHLILIKSIEVGNDFCYRDCAHFDCDYFLFDSPRGQKQREPLDIYRLQGMAIHRPFFIAGGMSSENVRERMDLIDPGGVDVSSGIEDRPGIKNASAMNLFVSAVRRMS